MTRWLYGRVHDGSVHRFPAQPSAGLHYSVCGRWSLPPARMDESPDGPVVCIPCRIVTPHTPDPAEPRLALDPIYWRPTAASYPVGRSRLHYSPEDVGDLSACGRELVPSEAVARAGVLPVLCARCVLHATETYRVHPADLDGWPVA